MKEIERILESIDNNRSVAIFGTGQVGQMVLHMAKAKSIAIKYFIDEYYKEEIFEGIPVVDIFDIMPEYDKLQIIIALGGADIRRTVCNRLKEVGVQQENIIEVPGMAEIKTDLFDPMLGYAIKYELEGYKVYGNKPKDLYDNASHLKVVLYGGSTTEHRYSGFESWGEIFSRMLKDKFKNVIVYNGGLRGYTSYQEACKCIRDIQYICPDLVIDFTGLNDIYYYVKATQNKNEKILTPLEYLENIYQGLLDTGQVNFSSVTYGLKDEEENQSAACDWLLRMRKMYAVCKEFHSEFIAYIQPTSFLGTYIKSEFETRYLLEHYSPEILESMRKGLKELVTLSTEIAYVHDLTFLFDNMCEMYVDMVHYTKEGNYIIANAIFKDIEQYIKSKGEEKCIY